MRVDFLGCLFLCSVRTSFSVISIQPAGKDTTFASISLHMSSTLLDMSCENETVLLIAGVVVPFSEHDDELRVRYGKLSAYSACSGPMQAPPVRVPFIENAAERVRLIGCRYG